MVWFTCDLRVSVPVGSQSLELKAWHESMQREAVARGVAVWMVD